MTLNFLSRPIVAVSVVCLSTHRCNMTTKINGQLEIDHERGVIYFHTTEERVLEQLNTVTILRICQLPKPIPKNRAIDITYEWTDSEGITDEVVFYSWRRR